MRPAEHPSASARSHSAEVRLAALIHASDDAIYTTALDGTITSWNRGAELLYGYSEAEVLGRPVQMLAPADRLHEVQSNLDAIAQGRLLPPYETVRRRKNGAPVEVSLSLSAIAGDFGEIIGISTIARDISKSKRSEKALRESERLFRSAFYHTNVAMVLTDLKHRFLRANDAFAQMFGYSAEEVLKLSMPDITHPADLPQSLALREKLLAGEVPFFDMEKRYRRKDGSLVWGLTNVSLVRDENDQPMLYVGQVQNITERKRSAEAIVQYNERLKILHEIDKALIAGEEPEAIAKTVLPLVRDLLGVTRVVVNLFDMGTGQVEWLAATGRRRVRVGPGVRYSLQFMGDINALRRGEHQLVDVDDLPEGPETRALLASGVRSYVVIPMLPGGELVGALSFGGGEWPVSAERLSIAREITAQFAIALTQKRLRRRLKKQTEELSAQNEMLTTLIDASPLAIFAVDALGRIKIWNQAAEQMFGWRAAEVLGRSLPPIVPAEKQAEFDTLTAAEKAGQSTAGLETFRLRRDGTRVEVILSAAPLRDAEGRIIGGLRIFADMTARRKLEEQLRHAQKMEAVGQLAGGVAHDFNNLLTIICGYSEVMLANPSTDSSLKDLIKEIRKAGDRAASLTRQLLAFSRKQVVEYKAVDLNSIINDIEKMLRRLIGEDISLATALDPTISQVKADAGQLEQIIMNLAVNARDAMLKGGKLTIETSNVELDRRYAAAHPEVNPGRYVLLAVSDTGCGMSEEVKSRIFEPFFTTKEVGRGTGLGLATVYGIVKQSGGHIWLYSEVGQGTTFKVYLPALEEKIPLSKSFSTMSPSKKGVETILVVEDEDAVRSLTVHSLSMLGYRVLEANCGAEAIRILKNHVDPVQLVVTDVVMPDMGGRKLADEITRYRPGIRVLFVSGYTNDAVVRHGVLAGEMAFLQKPFTPSVLAAKVREVLEHQDVFAV